MKAIQPSLGLFWIKMKELGGSDLQMPLYMILLWMWEKIFGHSEYTLRALNIPFFILSGVFVLYLWDVERRLKLAFVFLMCFSPMLWTYLDEARPYILQFCGATLILVALWNQTNKPIFRKNLVIFCTGSITLCGSSLTGMVFTFWFGLTFAAMLISQNAWSTCFRSKQNLIVLALTSIGLCGLGIFYFWTLTQGARASGVGKTDLLSIGFCLYELLGFTGMGPARLSLREHGITSLRPFLFQLTAQATTLTLFGYLSFIAFRKNPGDERKNFLIFGAAFCGAITMLATGHFAHFRVLGRHLMPVMPFILFLAGGCMTAIQKSTNRFSNLLVLLFCLILCLSSLSVRFSSRFAKDDYRLAVQIAKSASEKNATIWWAADSATANYYGLNFEKNLLSVGGFSTIELLKLPKPDIVIISKKDIYDSKNILSSFLIGKNFEKLYATAFTIYTDTMNK